MRALWASASGLSGMQTKIDTIAHNVANIDTTGFKETDVTFSDLLAETLKQDTAKRDPSLPAAYDLSLGHGVRPAYAEASFAQGTLQETGMEYDLALDGDGFFAVRDATGGIYYTRNGKFHLDGNGDLVNDQGMYVLDSYGYPIHIGNPSAGRAVIQADGTIRHPGLNGTRQIGLFLPVRTNGPQPEAVRPDGLFQPVGDGLFLPVASGGTWSIQAVNRAGSGMQGLAGTVRQGFLEHSNVDLTKEMTQLIQAQRVYQLNARAVETEDQMMGMANNMRA
jgi:flagellar basal-body rod protein FlgG